MPIHSISATIDRALTAAGLNTRSGSVKSVMHTIRTALSAAGVEPAWTARDDSSTALAQADDTAAGGTPGPSLRERPGTSAPPAPAQGRFLSQVSSGPAGSRSYKLFVPSRYDGTPAPLLMMLHGCTQDPDDFAAGTRMNDLAQAHGFLVAYPEQSANANGSRCWNWFHAQNQSRDSGEPSILVGIVGDISQTFAVDPRRVYVAGLSAGAAMAVILGTAYPDVFAAVGAHSGLPFGCAHDVGTAFAAMRGLQPPTQSGTPPVRRPADAPARSVPTIVFHGDRDPTVSSSNGDAISEQAVAQFDAQASRPLKRQVVEHTLAYGRRCTCIAYLDPSGRPRVEQWVLHGGSHAWSGGSTEGSFADAHGPDASSEMVRFFLSQELPRAVDV